MDYLRLAYLQALNIKATQKNNLFAVIVDSRTIKEVTDQHRRVFDFVIELDQDHEEHVEWKLQNEWQVFWLTPFKETIKLESDLLFTRSIDHWWTAMRERELVLSHGCRDYQQNISLSRKYRRQFDENHLPDVYNGLMYFRFSKTAQEFFSAAREIYENWEHLRDIYLKNCRDDQATTDMVYALASMIVGTESTTIPTMDFINFVHMKPGIQNWSDDQPWLEHVITEFDQGMIRINNINQYHPLHYQDKTFATDSMINHYERITGLTDSI